MIMKKISTVLCFILFAAVAVNAQEYKKFRVGVGAGYAVATGTGASGGVLFYAEPGYRFTDKILVNLRLESAVVVRGSANAADYDMSAAGIGSYTLNGQYFLMDGSFRPFIGAGLGMFSLAAVETSLSGGQEVAAGTQFGFYPRLGFEVKHFQLSFDFNKISDTGSIKNSYMGFRIGGYFGGGRK